MNSAVGNEEENAELALYRLEEIDELLGGTTGDEDDSQSATLAQYLRSGQDLESTLRQHDQELKDLRDAYIKANVSQAEAIAQLYHEFSACEQHVVDFDEEILSFQRKLEGNANDIVLMQQQTDGLVRKVNNRRQVSSKINEVYSALQKCDSFCDVISNKDVDANYLANLRELDRRLAFLSGNKALQHSAVDNEIRPKLTASALKAGDKLQRFLTKKIVALTEDAARTSEEQQNLEQSAQFAFRFLQLYNSPVAKEVSKLYIKYMSDFYVKQFRLLLSQFSEASEVHADPLEPLVSAEEVRDIMSNRDSEAPPGNQVNPATVNFPGRTLARRERSVSQHMRGFTDFMATGAVGAVSRAESLRMLRAATFEDTVKAVNALGVRYGKLHVDDAIAAQLDQCNSWSWQFVRCFQSLVNCCESECGFIGNFFCVAGDVEGGEDYTNAERIARAVLGRAVSHVETSIVEDLPLVMDRAEVLAGLRVLESMKQHLCTSLDPIPLLLLSGVLEMSKAALRNSLRTALKNDDLALAFLPTLKLSPFYRAPASGAAWAEILGNKAYCATLGPHPLVYRVCGVLGQLEYLNTTAVKSAAFSGDTQRAFDPAVAIFVKNSLAYMMSFIQQLKQRHPSPLAQQVFACVNVYTVLALWRELTAAEATTAAELDSPVGSSPSHSATKVSDGVGVVAAAGRPNVDGAPSASSREGAAAANGGVGIIAQQQPQPQPQQQQTQQTQYLEARLQEAIKAWVDADAQSSGGSTWQSVTKFVSQAVQVLGADFFDPGSSSSPASASRRGGGLPSLPAELSEAATLQVATKFSAQWQEDVKAMVDVVRKAIRLSLGRTGSGATSPAVATAQLRQCQELATMVLSEIFGTVAEANRKFALLVSQYYGDNRELQSKLVNNTAVLHEVHNILEGNA
ncbi:Vps52 / Sac2 family [Lotmaria passim]